MSDTFLHKCLQDRTAHFDKKFVAGLSFLILVFSLSACASLGGKFTPSTKADVNYFADQTIALLSQADFGFTRDEQIYTREFYHPDGDEEQKLEAIAVKVEELFDEIIAYSLDLVAIYSTHGTDAKRIEAFADRLEGPLEKHLRMVELSRETYDAIVKDIRNQRKFKDALQAAQPLLTGGAVHMNRLLDAVIVAVDDVAAKMDEHIEKRYADIVRYQNILEKEKYAVLGALEDMYLTIKGDKQGLHRLRASGTIWDKKVLPKGDPSYDDMVALYKYLMGRLTRLDEIGKEIESDWNVYRASHEELDHLYDKYKKHIRLARVMTITWVNAHQQMAAGITAPAEWFDIQKTGGRAASVLF